MTTEEVKTTAEVICNDNPTQLFSDVNKLNERDVQEILMFMVREQEYKRNFKRSVAINILRGYLA